MLAISRRSLLHSRKHRFISVLHGCRIENDNFSLEHSPKFIVGKLSDTTVAILMPIRDNCMQNRQK